jgi:hypothetical protein
MVLIVESGRDETIPHEVVAAYVAASRNTRHQIIADATHSLSDPTWNAAFVRMILNFFRGM